MVFKGIVLRHGVLLRMKAFWL